MSRPWIIEVRSWSFFLTHGRFLSHMYVLYKYKTTCIKVWATFRIVMPFGWYSLSELRTPELKLVPPRRTHSVTYENEKGCSRSWSMLTLDLWMDDRCTRFAHYPEWPICVLILEEEFDKDTWWMCMAPRTYQSSHHMLFKGDFHAWAL